MLFHCMPTKMPGAFAGKVTLTTLEGLFSCVLALMSFQIRCLSACIVALITPERPLSSVNVLVLIKTRSFSARIVALITIESLFP